FVAIEDVAEIEGFDEGTAEELQMRAREYLERVAAENDERRRELGVDDELAEIEGITPAIMVALGENEVKSVEDLAGCATDDLVGWTERQKGETVKHEGYLTGMDVSAVEAEAMIMAARVKAGWIAPEEAEA